MTIPNFQRPREEMTRRARWYLTIGGLRHLALGLFVLIWSDHFSNAVFIPIINFLPLEWWGILFLGAGGTCVTGAALRSASWARAGLLYSAIVTAVCASGLWLGGALVWAAGGRFVPFSAILLTSLAAKDIVQSAQPMRSPFEPLIKRVTRRSPGDL